MSITFNTPYGGLEGLIDKEMVVFEGVDDIIKERPASLNFVPDTRYAVVPRDIMLPELLAGKQITIIGDVGFGDGGKGKVNGDMDADIYYRPGGSSNAGHTFYYREMKFVTHIIPAGVVKEGAVAIIGSRVQVDPVRLLKEMQQFTEQGIDLSEKLFIGNSHITTPYHAIMDLIGKPPNSSTLQGVSDAAASMVTKTGVRLEHLFNLSDTKLMSRIKKDMRAYYGLLEMLDMTNYDVIERCRQENNLVPGRMPEHIMGFAQAGRTRLTDIIEKTPVVRDLLRRPLRQHFMEAKADYLVTLWKKAVTNNEHFPKLVSAKDMIINALRQGKKVNIEPTQSLWLDNGVVNFWESSTSNQTGIQGVLDDAGIPADCFDKIFAGNVIKFDTSRVGRGVFVGGYVDQQYFSRNNINTLDQMPQPLSIPDAQRAFFNSITEKGIYKPTKNQDTGRLTAVDLQMAYNEPWGEKGATTKKPRILGPVDLVLLAQAVKMVGPNLVLNAVDRYDEAEFVPVITEYVYFDPENKRRFSAGQWYSNGARITAEEVRDGWALPSEEVLAHCHPIIKLLPGWQGNPIAAPLEESYQGSLPQGVQRLVGEVEHFTNAKIFAIGNGPRDGNLIYLKKVA
jgi:adenylosuccinate synthase